MDDKCSQYVATVASNYGEIIKPFTLKYKWKGINYP